MKPIRERTNRINKYNIEIKGNLEQEVLKKRWVGEQGEGLRKGITNTKALLKFCVES